MPLDDLTIRNAKPAAKPSKLFDEKGLFLLITPTGSKLWRLKYRFAAKEKLLTLGGYPEISLKNARLRRDDARAMLREGRDPSAERKATKQKQALEARNAFKPMALEYIERMGKRWSERHRANAVSRLEGNVFPDLENRPIDKIEPPELLAVLRKIEARGAHEMAHRVRASGQVFRYAISCGVCTRDAAADLKGALTPPAHKPMPAVPIEDFPRLLMDIDGCEEAPACRDRQTRLGLQLIALTFLRPGELRKGLWEQVSWEDRVWTPQAEIMKMKRPHLVPLAPQAIRILEELYDMTGRSRFMFPGEGRKGVMSENTLNNALKAMGYDGRMCSHGFRSLASTILNESDCFDERWIEFQLAHLEKNKVKRAYNRAKWLAQRTEMMNWYSDYLTELRNGVFVKPMDFANVRKPALPLAA